MTHQMLPIRNPYLSALVEVERRLLFCTEAQVCYTEVVELVGLAAKASHVFILELVAHVASASDSASSPAADRTMRMAAEWRDDRAQWSIDWSSVLEETALASWLMALRQAEFLAKTQSNFSDVERQWLVPCGIHAVLLLPLVVHQQVQGAIGIVHQTEAHEWAPLEVDIWQGVALVLATKLEQLDGQTPIDKLAQQVQELNVNLATVTQQHTQRLQKALDFEALLKRITDRVRDSLDEGQILQTAVQELATGLKTYSCDTGRYDLEQATSTIAYEYIRSDQIPTAQGFVFQLSEHFDIYSQLLQGRYLQFCWIVPPVHPRLLNQPLAVLCCPIVDDQGVIGDIWLYHSADTFFPIEEIRLVEQVANQCAIAIRQARLYEAAQAQVRELEHLNYLKDDFLNTVSHELRSPMANIEMAIQMLELLLFQDRCVKPRETTSRYPIATADRCTADCDASCSTDVNHANSNHANSNHANDLPHPTSFQQSIRYFRMLQDECVRETNLINDLLDLSRLEAGTEPIVLTTIHLQTWIPHVVEPFLERARNHFQQLRVDVAEDLPLVSIDLLSLERILTELLHNACKYTPSGEEIRVTAEYASNDNGVLGITPDLLNSRLPPPSASVLASLSPKYSARLMLQVSNSGIEIPASELPRIFDKFYRIPSNDPWKHGGTGLGLALVKRLAEHLGAKIWAESANNQVVFILTLPLEHPAAN